MESSSRIALGIVASAALLLVGHIGYTEFQRHRDIAEAHAMMASLGDQGKQVVAEIRSQGAAQQQRQREEVAMSWDRRLLVGNQRCVGGVVVVAEGASYGQLGVVGDPVRCSGRYADRPIR